jgi:hypothetical protein
VASSSTDAFIGGGSGNQIGSSSANAAIDGGSGNIIEANAGWSVIGGGENNTTSSGWSMIAGGNGNVVGSGTVGSTIGGGYNNTNIGQYATVPGGYANLAGGSYSFAAGYEAQTLYNGSFIWSDSTGSLAATNNNSVTMRASGGYRLYSSSSSGVFLPAGSGSWNSLSDRHAKNHLAPVDPQAILAGVAALPISQWSYKTEEGVRHVGPMAQDFHQAFEVGENDTSISTVDEEGVALAAIQGLNQKVEEQKDQLKDELKAKEAAIQALQQRLERLEKLVSNSSNQP